MTKKQDKINKFITHISKKYNLRKGLIYKDKRKNYIRVKIGDPNVKGNLTKIKKDAKNMMGKKIIKIESYNLYWPMWGIEPREHNKVKSVVFKFKK